MPTFPAGCVNAGTKATELEELMRSIADEETFSVWLGANLDACCDDRFEDITELIELHGPTLADMQADREDLVQFLYEQKN